VQLTDLSEVRLTPGSLRWRWTCGRCLGDSAQHRGRTRRAGRWLWRAVRYWGGRWLHVAAVHVLGAAWTSLLLRLRCK
jgi:hypothetical protein